MSDGPIAIWSYGSNARGDADPLSDFDVLSIADFSISEREVASMIGLHDSPLAISRYSWSEIYGMASYGSLFLHHIQREGVCLVETTHAIGALTRVLHSLGPYKRAENDLAGFRIAVNDVRASLADDGSIPFELSILGSVLRHASILGCYVSGHPTFGRLRPVELIVDLWSLDQGIKQSFPELYRYRLWSDGRSEAPGNASVEYALYWCMRTDVLLKNLEDRINDYEGSLQKAVSASEGISQQ
jgi:hypothetical protein